MRTGTLIFKDEFADSSRGIGIWSSDAVVSKIRAFWPFAGTFFHFATFSHRNELRDQSVFFASLRFASVRIKIGQKVSQFCPSIWCFAGRYLRDTPQMLERNGIHTASIWSPNAHFVENMAPKCDRFCPRIWRLMRRNLPKRWSNMPYNLCIW
jgi:hypothetical protein